MSVRFKASAEHIDHSHDAGTSDLDSRVDAERVAALSSHLPIALLTVVVNSALLAYVLWGATDHVRTTAWLVVLWTVTLGRLALLRLYKRRPSVVPARRWFLLLSLGAAVNGLAWGASALMLYPTDDTTLQVFLAFVLGGMTAGATALSSTLFPAFVAFAIPALTPMIVRAFDEGDRVHFMIGVMLTLFGVAMAQIARTAEHRWVESARLRFKNEALVSELEETKEHLIELNRDLEARVADRTAELREASRVKDEFLAVVSHELRTPLTAVIGWAQMLKRGELPESKREHALQTIERNALAQAKLIDDLLDLSRITSSTPNIELVPVDPGPVVEAALDSIRPVMDAKGIAFEVHLDPTSDTTIRGDVVSIQRIIGNLLSNAAKFTPQGGRVVVKMHHVERWLEIVVSDTGEGMAPEFVPLAFDRFRQAHTSTRGRAGLGLGLAISRQLAQLHGGTLEAQSEGPGRGATFTLRLPLTRLRGSLGLARTAAAERSLSVPPDCLAGVDVLLVEDDEDTREVVGAMIDAAGATSISVAGTDEALAALKRQRPSVIVSDLQMSGSGGDGLALIRAVRQLSAEQGGDIPAIALTAHVGIADRSDAIAAGFQSYITKPVRADLLIEQIASVTHKAAS